MHAEHLSDDVVKTQALALELTLKTLESAYQALDNSEEIMREGAVVHLISNDDYSRLSAGFRLLDILAEPLDESLTPAGKARFALSTLFSPETKAYAQAYFRRETPAWISAVINQDEFEVFAIKQGYDLTKPEDLRGEDGRFPVVYFNARTEAAWCGWANRP